MSRNNHSKNRRTQTTVQRTGGRRTSTGRRTSRQTTSSGAIPSSMTNSIQSPEPLAMVEGARSKVMGLAGNALQSIKSHPLPYALAGVGVACAGAGLTWLLLSAAKHATDENGNAVDFPHRLQASMKDAQSSMKGARKSVMRATESANAKVSQYAHDAFESSKRIEQSVEDVVREHPIAVGAALLATGAAIALAMPRSVLEDTWVGRERDQVVSSAQKIAKGAVEKAQSLAKQVARSANGAAQA
jgi:ElaB/YqjD/DUF883 family membrane-anchored ribosome-binding protein